MRVLTEMGTEKKRKRKVETEIENEMMNEMMNEMEMEMGIWSCLTIQIQRKSSISSVFFALCEFLTRLSQKSTKLIVTPSPSHLIATQTQTQISILTTLISISNL